MLQKVAEMLDWEEELKEEGLLKEDGCINFVYLSTNDEVVGVSTNFQLSQYLRKKSDINLPAFNTLNKYGSELQKCLEKIKIVPGQNIYAMFFTVKKSLQRNKVALFFGIDLFHTLKCQGFKATFGRYTTAIGAKGILRDGG